MTLYLPITVDLYNPYPLKVMNIPQYNTGRGALITLTAAGSVIVPDKETLYIYAKKPDGTMVYASCELLGAQVRASFDEQMTAVAGVLDVEIQMVDASGNSITTTIFQINIMASNIDYARIVSSDDFIALRDALAMVSGIGDHTQLATENKSSLVAAVNELHTELEQQNVNIGRKVSWNSVSEAREIFFGGFGISVTAGQWSGFDIRTLILEATGWAGVNTIIPVANATHTAFDINYYRESGAVHVYSREYTGEVSIYYLAFQG